MVEYQKNRIPTPIIDNKEDESINVLTERYNKLIKPSKLGSVGTSVVKVIPQPIKNVGNTVKSSITEKELFAQCMKVVVEGFTVLEKQAAKFSVSEKTIIKNINKVTPNFEITALEEVCLARSYNISKLVSNYKNQDLGLALVEGGTTGFFGFAGLPYNLVLSTFLYYRAVQSIAMFYGYDIKNNPDELIIASDVFLSALSPNSKGSNEITGVIGKIMVMTEVTAVKQLSSKTWTEMAKHGGAALLICQMRAFAHASAKTALNNAGKKGLEAGLFKGVFEQIGKKMTQKAVGKAIPFVGAAIGALFDTAQMNKILEYADVFYCKRFLLEKEVRINTLRGISEPLDTSVIEI